MEGITIFANIGIVGFGGMGFWHFENASKIDGVKFIGAYDIASDRQQLIAEKNLRNYNSYDDMLNDPDINTILVATPNHLHKEMTIRAAKSKKNIICEKPVSLNVEELDEMIRVAEENGVIFTVHQNRRWDKDFVTVKEVLKNNSIGNVYSIQSRLFGVNGLVHDWHVYKKYGGGMLYDWGVHLIDQILQLVDGKLLEIYADLKSIVNAEVDDYFHIDLKFENGISVQIELGTYVLKSAPRWSVYGDRGTLTINSFLADGDITHTSKLMKKLPPQIAETVAGPTRAFAPPAPGTLYQEELPEVVTKWTDFYENYVAVLNNKAELKVKLHEVRRVLSVMEKVFESSEKGKSLPFEK